MQRRHFLRGAGLTAASVLLLGPATMARTLILVPTPPVDPAQYGVWEIQSVVMGFATTAPAITYPVNGGRTSVDGALPRVRWQVPVADVAAFLEAGRYLMLGHFGTVYAQGSTLSFVYSGAQHEVTLVLPASN